MEATHELAAILRDAAKTPLLRMRSEFISQPPSQAKRRRDRHCEERSDEAIHSSFARRDGLLRVACHRARIRATRWLAMTVRHTFAFSRRDWSEALLRA